jgi:hypothetical protein
MDQAHLEKLADIYRPRLEPIVSPALLDEKAFFKNYQLLRNISLLATNDINRVIFLLPEANTALHPPLRTVLDGVHPHFRNRITVAYVEECLSGLEANPQLSESLRLYARTLIEKYVV